VSIDFSGVGESRYSFPLVIEYLVHLAERRRTQVEQRKIMKPEIHPEYKETQVTCGCGEKFVTRSTVASGSIYVEVCSVCHPFYTGKQRILDTGGRVAKFEERFGKKSAN